MKHIAHRWNFGSGAAGTRAVCWRLAQLEADMDAAHWRQARNFL